jgi:8-oxo-dGTP pyrophosphatase MutT (NUDIX family)
MVQRTATSAGAIILREVEGKLKVALAHHPRRTKSWVLPKGHVEEGESLEQAALREIYEEVGLDNVQLIKHLGTITRESVKSNGDVEQKTIHFYLAYAPGDSQSHAVLATWGICSQKTTNFSDGCPKHDASARQRRE